jgi:signal transduction histidine kinase
MKVESMSIRPAARLLRTIGQDLIKDVYSAIVELVKNSYDADSDFVRISFDYNDQVNTLSVSVYDIGHGMTRDVVLNKWLVPATSDKLERKKSDKGRVLQGRKGIGRFAASILGERVLLESSSDGETTSLLLDMDELEKVEYLDEFRLDVESELTDKKNGTLIEIEKSDITAEDVGRIWNPKQLRKLLVELRGLIAPEEVYSVAEKQGYEIAHDKFKIELVFKNFPVEEFSNKAILIEPFPVLDLYDYKISGKVSSSGKAELLFENNNFAAGDVETIQKNIWLEPDNESSFPGDIFVDFRVYDRDPESIQKIISRGLKDPHTGQSVGRLEARKILDEFYGVGVYREQFRIRPYGEQSFDWLDLDKMRVQNPSFKIGHNQIVGFVYVRPEESSGLQEKSARDGLVENEYYYGLIEVVSSVIRELETRRFSYRKKSSVGRRRKTLGEDVDILFDFEEAKARISLSLDNLELSSESRESVVQAVSFVLNQERDDKATQQKRLRDTIAIYEGQVTLGKITHLLLHEGRKHIKFISETIPRMVDWSKKVALSGDEDLLAKLNDRTESLLVHAKGISSLFKRIEPLARTRRASDTLIKVKSGIESTFDIFTPDLKSNNIKFTVIVDDPKLTVKANQLDFITVFSNLIENSIYWLSAVHESDRFIQVHVFCDEKNVFVEFLDSGPGFQGADLELMFEPGYSTRKNGTGLGLSLVGEAVSRMNGQIQAKSMDASACFEMVFKEIAK